MDVLKIPSSITHIYPGNHTYTEILTSLQNNKINYIPPPVSLSHLTHTQTHTQKPDRPCDITGNKEEESMSTETGWHNQK